MTVDELHDRITELEIRFTHQSQTIEELNAEVTESHRRIDNLEREVKRYDEMLKSMAPNLTESPDE